MSLYPGEGYSRVRGTGVEDAAASPPAPRMKKAPLSGGALFAMRLKADPPIKNVLPFSFVRRIFSQPDRGVKLICPHCRQAATLAAVALAGAAK